MAAQQRKIDIKRRQAAEAACRVIQRGGVEAANLRAIAAEMGATTGLLTRYFPSRRELLHFTLSESGEILNRHLQAAIAGLSGRAALRAAVQAALPLDEPRRSAWALWAVFLGLIAADAGLAAIHDQFPQALRAVLIRSMREAQRGGQLAPSLYPPQVADGLLCQITGASVRMLGDPAAKIEAVAAGAFAAILGHAAHNPSTDPAHASAGAAS